MVRKPININSKFKLFSDYWSPRVVAEINNYQIKLVKIKGDFIWHQHKETDEVFLVIEGSMGIQFKEGTVLLNKGEMFVVKKSKRHKPFAIEECKVMIIEPKGVINTGEKECEFTFKNNLWI
tara:strand:+ start:828 stop:1193 length:366 start_codon:yes stop_codon:yes gene_type:complete